MPVKIALAGNPNSGKTTLFNLLTGSNQFVGNWPGVTVEKKEGKLKNETDVTIIDLPGIYSLSPYTLEEVVARNYLIDERPDAILNIVDGTNLERNLYLTTQLTELGIPVVVAVNMMDVVKRNGDKIDFDALSKALGCKVYDISALKSQGISEASEAAVDAARKSTKPVPAHKFGGTVEHALAHIEERLLHDMPIEQQRWYAIKLFERDAKIIERLEITQEALAHIEQDIAYCETEMDDDAESIITSERYTYIESIIKGCYKRKSSTKTTTSDKIDKIVTNRWLALPIFAVVMFVVYFVSVTTVGSIATDWANDGVFGEGWHLLGIGSKSYGELSEVYDIESAKIDAYITAAEEYGIDTQPLTETLESEQPDPAVVGDFLSQAQSAGISATAVIRDDNGDITEEIPVKVSDFSQALEAQEPDPADHGVWVPGIPVLLEKGMQAINTAPWLQDLVISGIVGGVGAVLGFVPQILILFIFLAFLESCGYMARIAFIMDRLFRKFGLSGKSFIPLLIGTGCSVPGIMASRTIESERDRRMTIMTTSFVPCGAKLPVIALIASALFGRAWWVAPSAYFIGIAAVIISGIILKKTKMFSGDPAPFIMELPAYHWPTAGNIFRSMWERGWAFIKKAGTIILLSTIVLWFLQGYGTENGSFGAVTDINNSILAKIGGVLAPIFAPLGWGDWKPSVAAVTGLIAKENIVGTFGVLYGGLEEVAETGWQIWEQMRLSFTALSAYSFLVFNLLCAPCFAAIGAIRREMNSGKWTWFAILYQTLFAYGASLCVFQLGSLFTGGAFGIGTAAAMLIAAVTLYFLFRPNKYAERGSKLQLN